jgi:7,8-dihydropterin-6-yl-methyl-4-(beta-D-ribofuranosyl)aminobenzene 5'-phosphate synthase
VAAPVVDGIFAAEGAVARPTVPLLAADAVRITIVTDNSIDLLMAGTEVACRLPLGANPFEHPLPIAEHGFSVLIEVRRGERRGTVLFDTGVSCAGLLHNLDALEIDPADIGAIVLSHGHPDHAMGLPGLITRLGRRLPLVLHPEAYLERKLVLPNGDEVNLPPPRRTDLRQEQIEVVEEVGPSLLVDGTLLVSGEVARTTEFERGFPIHWARRNGVWESDPLIKDDQCAIVNVRDEGLLIVTGCGHAGIINIVRNAQAITGVERVYAVIGGFHLTGRLFEPLIPATVAALQQLAPRYVVPGHCTGWMAAQHIARAMPEAFIANSVGTTFVL